MLCFVGYTYQLHPHVLLLMHTIYVGTHVKVVNKHAPCCSVQIHVDALKDADAACGVCALESSSYLSVCNSVVIGTKMDRSGDPGI